MIFIYKNAMYLPQEAHNLRIVGVLSRSNAVPAAVKLKDR